MYFLSFPLRTVPVPPVKNRRRHIAWLLAVWAGYSAVIGVGVYLIVHYFLDGAALARTPTALYVFAEALVLFLSWFFTANHASDAKAKRWRNAAYPVYGERVTEAKSWTWLVVGAAMFEGKWRIVCIRSADNGSDVQSLSVLPKYVTLVEGDSDRLAFGDIRFAAARSPGNPDKIMVGGQITLTYDIVRGGPPPLKTELDGDN